MGRKRRQRRESAAGKSPPPSPGAPLSLGLILSRLPVAPIAFWVSGGCAARLLAHTLAPPLSVSWYQIWFAGVIPDLILFAAGYLALRKAPRSVQVAAVALGWGVMLVNALFLSWSHFPLDFSYLGYLDAVPQLWFSAGDMIAISPWVVIAGICWLGAAVKWELWHRGRLWTPRWWPKAALGYVVAGMVLGPLLAPASEHGRAVGANVWLYAAERAFAGMMESSQVAVASEEMRERLSTGQGHFQFSDGNFPLLQRAVSYGERLPGLEGTPALRELKRPHVVMIFMESFRGRDIGALGGDARLTPVFDGLAAEGWLWDRFYGNGVQTSRGAVAALSGMYPSLGPALAQRNPDFPLLGLGEILQEKGYKTEYYHNGSLKFANKVPFFRNLGFDKIVGGQDLVADFEAERFGWGIPDHILFQKLADRLNAAKPEEPLLLGAFTVSTHHPWRVPLPEIKVIPETGAQYDAYRNCMRYSDYSLGLLFAALRPEVRDNTLFIITADTAQPMGEHHDNYALLNYLYEENVHIPLLIYSPALLGAPQRLSQVGSQVDLTPTVLDLLGYPAQHHAVGRSLLAQPEGEPWAFFSSPYSGGWVGLREGDWKYFYHQQGDKPYLFNLATDPGEQQNLAATEPERVKGYQKRLSETAEAVATAYRGRKVWRE